MGQSCFLQRRTGQKLGHNFLSVTLVCREENAQKCRSASPGLNCEDLSLTFALCFRREDSDPKFATEENCALKWQLSPAVLAMDSLYLLMCFSLNQLLLDHIFAAGTHGKLLIFCPYFTLHHKCMLMCNIF